jgi:hypothetical protein
MAPPDAVRSRPHKDPEGGRVERRAGEPSSTRRPTQPRAADRPPPHPGSPSPGRFSCLHTATGWATAFHAASAVASPTAPTTPSEGRRDDKPQTTPAGARDAQCHAGRRLEGPGVHTPPTLRAGGPTRQRCRAAVEIGEPVEKTFHGLPPLLHQAAIVSLPTTAGGTSAGTPARARSNKPTANRDPGATP